MIRSCFIQPKLEILQGSSIPPVCLSSKRYELAGRMSERGRPLIGEGRGGGRFKEHQQSQPKA